MSKKKTTKVSTKIDPIPTENPTIDKEQVEKAAKTYWENRNIPKKKAEPLLYEKSHFIIMGIGIVLLIVGFVLMSGGAMPDENTWDPNIIYSFTRVTLAPIVVLSGLAVFAYALFYSGKDQQNSEESE